MLQRPGQCVTAFFRYCPAKSLFRHFFSSCTPRPANVHRGARSRRPRSPGQRVCPRLGAARGGRLLSCAPTARPAPAGFPGSPAHVAPAGVAASRGEARLEPAAVSRELLRNSRVATPPPSEVAFLGWKGAGAPPEPPRPRFVGTMLNRDLSRQGRPWKPSEPGGGEGTSKGGRTSLSVRKCF